MIQPAMDSFLPSCFAGHVFVRSFCCTLHGQFVEVGPKKDKARVRRSRCSPRKCSRTRRPLITTGLGISSFRAGAIGKKVAGRLRRSCQRWSLHRHLELIGQECLDRVVGYGCGPGVGAREDVLDEIDESVILIT